MGAYSGVQNEMQKRNLNAGVWAHAVLKVSVPLVACCALQVGSGVREAQKPEKVAPADYLPRYRRILHELASNYRDVVVEGTETVTRPLRESAKEKRVASTKDTSTRFTYVRTSDREKLVLGPGDEPAESARTVVVNSDHRRFRLFRKPTSGSWYVDIDLRSDNEEFPAFAQYRSRLTAAAFSPGCLPGFVELVDSGGFTVREVVEVSADGVALEQVRFLYVPAEEGKPRIEGWVRLDPAMGRVVHDYDFESKGSSVRDAVKREWTMRTKGFVTYRKDRGKPVPAEVEVATYVNGNRSSTHHYGVARYSLRETPSEDFTLAAFGLADYDRTVGQVERRTTYRTAVLAGTAFLVALFLFAVGRRVHRARGRTVRTSATDKA